MKIYAFADEAGSSMEHQILAMKRNGLNGLEIRNVDNVNILNITIEKTKEVKKMLDASGLITWSIGSPIGKIDIEKDDFEAHLEKFKYMLEVAHVMEAENMRLFSFFIPQGQNPANYKAEVIDRMGRFVEIAKGSNVCLCHENEKGIYGDNATRCQEIYLEHPQIKGVFDPANYVQCGQDTLEAWELLHPYIKYLHIKDALADGSVVPAGAGIGNVKEIISAFYKQGGTEMTIEPHLSIFQGLSDLEREGEKSNIGKYVYKDNDAAFNAACEATKALLEG